MNQWQWMGALQSSATRDDRDARLCPLARRQCGPIANMPLSLALTISLTRWGSPLIEEQTTKHARCLVFIM
jgi:hypothetical protein